MSKWLDVLTSEVVEMVDTKICLVLLVVDRDQ